MTTMKETTKETKVCKVIEPSVFEEVTKNTVNPLEPVREGIANGVDAGATRIKIEKYIDPISKKFTIKIIDDGSGMEKEEIEYFFNIGDSHKSEKQIGCKGFGTKTFLKSSRIELITQKNGKRHKAILDEPWRKIEEEETLEYTIEEIPEVKGEDGTSVAIVGYAIDHPEKVFAFRTVKDYILWKTAAGSFKTKFLDEITLRKNIANMTVSPIVTIDDQIENMKSEFIGEHVFGRNNEEYDLEKISSDIYCKTFEKIHRETIIDGKYVSFQIYGTISGREARKAIAEFGVGEGQKSRFGVLLCKDFINITNTKDLFIDNANYNHYHLMLNSQNFELTSDRNNIRNEDSPEYKWIMETAKEVIHENICKVAEKTYFKLKEEEEKALEMKRRIEDMKNRLEKYSLKKNLDIKGFPVVKVPTNESQTLVVLTTMIALGLINDLVIGDYSSLASTDLIVEDTEGNIELIEVEYRLSNLFLHEHPIDSFDSIICWQVDVVEDYSKKINGTMLTVKKDEASTWLEYGSNKKIKVVELKRILDQVDFNDIKAPWELVKY